jgi:hypothetical protein
MQVHFDRFEIGRLGRVLRTYWTDISFEGDTPTERSCTVVGEYFIIDGDASIGNNMIDGARRCHGGRCAEEIDLIIPVSNVAADEFDTFDRQYI